MRNTSSIKSRTDDTGQGLEDNVLRSLRRIIRAVDLYSRKLVRETGLSGPQLICLRQLEKDGAMQVGVLANAVHLSPATVTGILDRLEARQFVQRVRQTDDKRRVRVSLTRAGRQILEKAPPALQDGFLFKFRALSAGQQVQIHRTLSKLVSMMSADDLDAAPILTPGESVSHAPGRRAARD